MTNSIHELGDAACIMVVGSNPSVGHPVIALEVLRSARNGGKSIIINPREIPLVKHAYLWLQHRPGTDVALLMGMMRVIVEEGLLDTAFIEKRCENYEAFKKSLTNFGLDTVERITGVPRSKVVEAARIFATTRPASIIYAMGITQHSHGTDNVLAIANLAMLTGNIGKPSTGVNPLRGQNNVQGACDMGALPNVFTGYQQVGADMTRKKFENAWAHSLNPTPGLTLTEIFGAARRKQVKALYLIGENPVLSDADSKHVKEALESLDFLVVQDIFLTETAQLADVVLPGVSFAEKNGTFTNTERRVQRVRQAVPPAGEAKQDWWITCQMAKRMGGRGFNYDRAAEIFEEISRLTPSYGGITYERLEKGGLQWPCPTDDHPGTPTLHTEMFARGKGQFTPLTYKPPQEMPDEQYPLVLTTERSLYHYHTGTMTRKVKGLNHLRSEETVEISPEDAKSRGISDGDLLKVTSRRGSVTARAHISKGCPAGVVAMSFHFAESPVNTLTSPALDPVSKIPELKVCAVRVEKAG